MKAKTKIHFFKTEANCSLNKRLSTHPIRMLEVELSDSLPAVSTLDITTGQRYQRASALVRLHTQPLGVVDLELHEDGLTAAEYARHIWSVLSQEINEHLRQDGLSEVTELNEDGIPVLD